MKPFNLAESPSRRFSRSKSRPIIHTNAKKKFVTEKSHSASPPSSSSSLSPGGLLELQVASMVLPGGQGLAKLPDGMTVLVKGALPGQTVRARVLSVKSRSVEAEAVEALTPPDHFVPPPCPHFGACGGCLMQSIDYPAQLDIKRRHVIESLVRNGRVPHEVASSLVRPTLPSPQVYGYRNKLEFSFSRQKWDPSTGLVTPTPLALGLHRPGCNDQVLEVSRCLLQDETANQILEFVGRACREEGLEAFGGEGAGARWGLTHLTIRRGSDTSDAAMSDIPSQSDTAPPPAPHATPTYMAILSSRGKQTPKIDQSLSKIAAALVNHVGPSLRSVVHVAEAAHPRAPPLATRVLVGDPTLRERLAGCEFEVSPASFFQTNTAQADAMYRLVASAAALSPGESLLDLYCGTGTFALTTAKAVPRAKVMGFDLSASAVADAARNASRNGLSNASFLQGDLGESDTATRLRAADVVVADPARAGLSESVIAFLRSSPATRRLVYVSCNPDTFARDLARLSDIAAPGQAYVAEHVTPMDMFPHAGHVELIAVLGRAGRGGA